MKIIVTKTQTKEIDHCYYECPYFESGHEISCGHPKAPNSGYIITLLNSRNGFPESCPLLCHCKKGESCEIFVTQVEHDRNT